MDPVTGAQAISDALVYRRRDSAISGSKMRQNVPSYNLSEAGPGRTLMFNIPCGCRGQFLSPRSSFLKFRVNNATASPMTLDYSAHAFIQRLELYHGSNLLEQISEYNVLAHVLKDIGSGLDHRISVGSALEGSSIGDNRTGGAVPAGAGTPLVPGERVFVVQLLSGLIGGLQDKYLPVGAMVGDLRLELTLAGVIDPFISLTTVPNWTIDKAELMLEYVQLQDSAAAMVTQMNPEGYMISFDSFSTFSSTIPTGTSSINTLIPARYSVLKTLLTSIRSDNNRDYSSKTITDRKNLFLNKGEWYYSVGGVNMPATPVKTSTEAYAEMLKAQHALGSTSAPTMLQENTWNAAEGSFLIAQDLEYLHGKSSKASNGVNTLSVNTHLIGKLAAPTGAEESHTVDSFAHYEGIMMVINGVAAVRT